MDTIPPPAVDDLIIGTLVQIIHKAAYIDNQPVSLDDGPSLSAAEIHLIDAVGSFSDETLSSLATRLGITKGAVSQFVTRLETKGYLVRHRQSGNRKNVSLVLTAKGQKAYCWHQTLHERINRHILDGLSDLTVQDREHLVRILGNLSTTLDVSLLLRDEHTKEFLSVYQPTSK